MNAKKIVRLSNTICIVSVLLLTYWVFTFIVMEVFGLKVFRENITETFYFSILAIIALMSGALITNVMFNLTRIAEKHNDDAAETRPPRKSRTIAFIVSFPLLVALLFAGDFLTSRKKEALLIESAESMTTGNRAIIDGIGAYEFSREWIVNAEEKLELLSNMDVNYGNVSLVASDTIDGIPVFLMFGRSRFEGDEELSMVDFIFKSDIEQRDYLDGVFGSGKRDSRFTSSDGEYEMFVPVEIGGRTLVLYFQDRQRYGKLGS